MWLKMRKGKQKWPCVLMLLIEKMVVITRLYIVMYPYTIKYCKSFVLVLMFFIVMIGAAKGQNLEL